MITPQELTAETTAGLSDSIRSLARRIALWARTWTGYCAAAASYEHLSGLSDAELRNRELSRDTLARDLSSRRRGLA
jgi:hypothetical protein